MLQKMYEKLLSQFLELAKLNSVNNNIASLLYFHSLMGAFFNNKTIRFGSNDKDMRIHPLWIQASRTGKDQLNKVLEKCAKAMGLKAVTITDISSDASLIGTYDSNIHKINVEKGLNPENPIKTIGAKTYFYQDPIIKGDLGHYDILIISESKLLFQIKSEKLLTILQPVMDTPGWVRKKMRDEKPVEYYCNCTLIMTSIPFKEMSQSIVDQGFFQRCTLFIRRLTVDEIASMRRNARKLFFNEKSIFNNKLKQFAESIKSLNREPQTILLSEDCLPILDNIQNQFIKEIKTKIKGHELINALSFTQTAEDITIKIAGHICLMEDRNIILPKDINSCYIHTIKFMRTIIDEIDININKEEKLIHDQIYTHIRQIFNMFNNEPIQLTVLTKALSQKANVGINKARRVIEEMKNINYLKFEDGEKNTTIVKLN
jgi:hypothetical protein